MGEQQEIPEYVLPDKSKPLGELVAARLSQKLDNANAQIRDLQQALRTERDARRAAEEARDGYRVKAERAEAHVEVLSQALQLQVPLTRLKSATDSEVEVRRLRHLVEWAYAEGIVDVFTRGACISKDNNTWETADAKVAMDDIEYHRTTCPEHFAEGDG